MWNQIGEFLHNKECEEASTQAVGVHKESRPVLVLVVVGCNQPVFDNIEKLEGLSLKHSTVELGKNVVLEL